MSTNKTIVIAGAGHAGIEAALAASRIGVKVIIITMDTSAVARMSCNPAIGGLGKGHLVKEIDALGGLMGFAADQCGLQFKTLNKSKGRAVWSLRAQIDKNRYPQFVTAYINKHEYISILQGEVVDFSVNNSRLDAVILRDGTRIITNGLIITSGTFLNGLMHIGRKQYPAGRFGEKATAGLTEALVAKGFTYGRLKTGTPPRLLKSSINWSKTTPAFGDDKPTPFSILTKAPFIPLNHPCQIVNTNSDLHELLSENINESAMYSGRIKGVGPRYCPSIEDKIMRFKSRESHQLFLEPEWENSEQIYLNGFSTSLPEHIQLEALRKIPAFEKVKFIRPGYAIEYDYIPTHQLKNTLESKTIEGLFFAGQINGTSGYEEAASQGLIAGANSALMVLNKGPLIIKRNEGYIGVLIDDLITKNINEPYRMFTSSAEHRLSLRGDNACLRLTEMGYNAGLISSSQYDLYNKFKSSVTKANYLLNNTYLRINGRKICAAHYIKQQGKSVFDKELLMVQKEALSENVLFTAETDIKYEGYVAIENHRLEKLRKMENYKIPYSFDYLSLLNISTESREKLCLIKPETLGQASRVAGVRPSDIAVIAITLQSRA